MAWRQESTDTLAETIISQQSSTDIYKPYWDRHCSEWPVLLEDSTPQRQSGVSYSPTIASKPDWGRPESTRDFFRRSSQSGIEFSARRPPNSGVSYSPITASEPVWTESPTETKEEPRKLSTKRPKEASVSKTKFTILVVGALGLMIVMARRVIAKIKNSPHPKEDSQRVDEEEHTETSPASVSRDPGGAKPTDGVNEGMELIGSLVEFGKRVCSVEEAEKWTDFLNELTDLAKHVNRANGAADASINSPTFQPVHEILEELSPEEEEQLHKRFITHMQNQGCRNRAEVERKVKENRGFEKELDKVLIDFIVIDLKAEVRLG